MANDRTVFGDKLKPTDSEYGRIRSVKVSEGTNRNMPARNTLVRRLALYTNLRARMHSVTDRRTDNRITPIADHAVYQYDQQNRELGLYSRKGVRPISHVRRSYALSTTSQVIHEARRTCEVRTVVVHRV